MKRSLIATAAGPLIAAGIFLGNMTVAGPAVAGAQPGDAQCSGMTMTDGQNAGDPNAMTRAGQVRAATAPAPSDGSMPVNCQPASHG